MRVEYQPSSGRVRLIEATSGGDREVGGRLTSSEAQDLAQALSRAATEIEAGRDGLWLTV